MRTPMIAISSLALVLALSACRDHSDITPADDATPAAADASADAMPPGEALDAARYTCDGDHRVTVEGDSAQVEMADGTNIELSRSAGSTTATFSSGAVEFTGDAEGGTLVIDDDTSATCRAG